MTPAPTNAADVARLLAEASARKAKIGRMDLGALNRVLAHTPEDMTATVEAGVTLAALQRELARHRQWLPIDPAWPERLSIGEIIDTHASGPRRFGYGTVRDYLLGITVALADGTVIKSGGKVVKNVAGYDLAKLFIGGKGSLCVALEATFKLRPLPAVERFARAQFGALEEAERLVEAVAESELTPVVFDLHRLEANTGEFVVVAGFAGEPEDVEWQLAKAREIGLAGECALDYEERFLDACPAPRRWSVLPSRLGQAVRGLQGAAFVARAGNGIIYHAGARQSSDASGPGPDAKALAARLKAAFDPHGILPSIDDASDAARA